MRAPIRSHEQLDVYQIAFRLAMDVFSESRRFPKEERYSLTDQVRRSSRSVCANLAEARRKRRYKAAFTSKLNDAEAEAAETQTWLDFSKSCGYLAPDNVTDLRGEYDRVLGKLVTMIRNPEPWILYTK